MLAEHTKREIPASVIKLSHEEKVKRWVSLARKELAPLSAFSNINVDVLINDHLKGVQEKPQYIVRNGDELYHTILFQLASKIHPNYSTNGMTFLEQVRSSRLRVMAGGERASGKSTKMESQFINPLLKLEGIRAKLGHTDHYFRHHDTHVHPGGNENHLNADTEGLLKDDSNYSEGRPFSLRKTMYKPDFDIIRPDEADLLAWEGTLPLSSPLFRPRADVLVSFEIENAAGLMRALHRDSEKDKIHKKEIEPHYYITQHLTALKWWGPTGFMGSIHADIVYPIYFDETDLRYLARIAGWPSEKLEEHTWHLRSLKRDPLS